MPSIDTAEMFNGRRNPDPPMVRLLATAAPYEGAPWEPVIPLSGAEPPDAPFPTDALPEPLQSFIVMLAAAHQAPTAMIATHALAALSGLLCGKIVTHHGNGGVEQAGLFALTFAPSGARKSRIHAEVMRPIVEEETQAALAADVDRRRVADDLKDVRTKIAEARRRKASAEELNALYRREIDLEAAVRDPHFILTDTTDEGLQRMLAENGGVCLIASPESQILSIAAGRYSEAPVFDVLLGAYSGDPVASARRNRAVERIQAPSIALALMTQPSVMQTVASIRDAAPRGLLARFLYCAVGRTDRPDMRRNARGAPVNVAVQMRYRDLVRRLAALPLPDRQGARMVVRLDDGAERLRDELHDQYERAILQDPEASFAPWLDKAVGNTVRVAAVLHAIQSNDFLDRPISIETLDRAHELMEFYRAHAEAIHPKLTGEESQTAGHARFLLKWIVAERRFDGFSLREAQRRLHHRFRTSKQLTAALAFLEERGYVRVTAISTGGRPTTAVEVHPDLRQVAAGVR